MFRSYSDPVVTSDPLNDAILAFIRSFITNERAATTAHVNMSPHAGGDEEQESGLSL